jgi:hypothetical protein
MENKIEEKTEICICCQKNQNQMENSISGHTWSRWLYFVNPGVVDLHLRNNDIIEILVQKSHLIIAFFRKRHGRVISAKLFTP